MNWFWGATDDWCSDVIPPCARICHISSHGFNDRLIGCPSLIIALPRNEDRIIELYHNRILRYHIARGLAAWAILEIMAIALSAWARPQIKDITSEVCSIAASLGVKLHPPSIGPVLLDTAIALLASVLYTQIALTRREDCILLGNLGIGPIKLAMMIAGVALLMIACTWRFR